MSQAEQNRQKAIEIEKQTADREAFLLSTPSLKKITDIANSIQPVELIAKQLGVPYTIFKKHLNSGERIVGTAVLEGEWTRFKSEWDFTNRARMHFLTKQKMELMLDDGQNAQVDMTDPLHYQAINDAWKHFLKMFMSVSFYGRLKKWEERAVLASKDLPPSASFNQLVLNLNAIMDKKTGIPERADATFRSQHLQLSHDSIEKVLKREQ